MLNILVSLSAFFYLIGTSDSFVPLTCTTSDYFRAGNYDIISDFTTEGDLPIPSYTFVFSSSFSGIPSLAYGIKSY